MMPQNLIISTEVDLLATPEAVGDDLVDAPGVEHDNCTGGDHAEPQAHRWQQKRPAVLARALNEGPDVHGLPGHGEQIGVQLAKVQHLPNHPHARTQKQHTLEIDNAAIGTLLVVCKCDHSYAYGQDNVSCRR